MTCHRLGHVSPELRAALDDPRTRYRIVDAWRARVKAEIKGETTDDLTAEQAIARENLRLEKEVKP